MKKIISLIVPIIIVSMASCNGGQTVVSTSTTPTSVTTTTSSTTREGPSIISKTSTITTPEPSEYDFDLSVGNHVHTIDFEKDFEVYKKSFLYVEADTGKYNASLANLNIIGLGCFVGSYNSTGYLMMKNKDMGGTMAFIASQTSLGKITKITLVAGSSASTTAKYNILITDELPTESSTNGEQFSGKDTFVATGSGAYFVITSNNTSKNGQIGVLTIEYTIEK